MADYYTLASFIVKLNDEQIKIALDALSLAEDEDANLLSKYTRKYITDNYSKDAISIARKYVRKYPGDYEQGWPWYNFNAEKEREGLWIYSDESINTDCVATFIQLIFRHFSIEGYLGFEVAHSCSKARLDAYGGHAVFITKDEIRWFSTHGWINKKILQYSRRESKAADRAREVQHA